MPKGGRLQIETANAELDERYAQIRPEVVPGHYAMVAVSDTGCGMDRVTQARIFEPFFTTKEPGKGAGLGLATAYGIIKQSNGYIYVYSEPGHGTTFKVYLPLTEVAAATPASDPSPPPRGAETVLLVEDEEGIRNLLNATLKEQGYTVLSAAHGNEALEIATKFDRPIDLLLTDVVMPEMGGRALAEHVARSHPEVKILFMSGYTDDMVMRHGVLQAEVEFLQKPYTLVSLLRKIRAVLDSGTTRIAPNGAQSVAQHPEQ
jgi:CheY-like chemotaxis protein